jgi:serine/threonine protein kinase/Tol biopolymer transport system component
MPLSPGARLGPYEITAQIGVGGMGEVYRATDTHLKRSVAIKVLPDAVSADPERLARFQREAEVLASLNHPNIAQVYGLEKSQAIGSALVMELVEGPTLAERIAATPMPVDEALAIARQIVESLEAAHEQGIVHRDLKPANVKVREDGTVKVLDFGLAKALEPASAPRSLSPSSITLSPTITTPAMTQVGFILGSAAYMSPEQARGKTVDRRTDIWAFGCVLYEMLTGKRAFDADDVSLTLARVLERDVDLTVLPAAVPPRVRQVIATCLRKDVRQRLQAIGDVRLALDGVFETAPPVATIDRAAPRRPLWLRVAPFAALTAIAAAAIGFVALRRDSPPQVTRFQIHAPAGSTLPLGTPAISPDGRTIAYTVTDAQGVTQIHVRPLDSIETRVLPGTENAVHPFWFADGRSLGFASVPDNYLKRIDVGAGAARTLFHVTGPWQGTSSQDGTLLFLGDGIRRWVNGETALQASTRRTGETGGSFPFFLPDGKRFLILVSSNQGSSIQLATIGAPDRSVVVDSVDGAAVMTRIPTGKSYLLFVRTTDLLAQEFDEASGVVRGSPKVIVNDIGLVANPPIRPSVGASSGVLAYQTGGVVDVPPLIWVSRAGTEVQRLTRGASVRNPRLSADGERLLGSRFTSGRSATWVTDLRRGSSTQIIFSGSAFDAVWSPDGAMIAYRRINGRGYIAGADGERQVAESVARLWDWSPDGRMLLVSVAGGFTLVPVDNQQKPIVVQPPSGRLREGYFSPDGRYIVFVSDESGRDEVYVQAIPPASFRTKISINGGVLPRWRADGKELFFVSPDSNMMSVDVNTNSTFSAGIPRPLFKTSGGPNLVNGYAVRADGQQFLMPGRDAQAETWPITVVLNWWAELE